MNCCKNCKHSRKNRTLLGFVWYECFNINSRRILRKQMPWQLCSGYEPEDEFPSKTEHLKHHQEL